MVNCGVCSLTGLLQAIVYWPHPLKDCVGFLRADEELAGGIRYQEEDLFSGLEVPWLGGPVVDPLLLSLGRLHVFPNSGSYMVNTILHFLHILDP